MHGKVGLAILFYLFFKVVVAFSRCVLCLSLQSNGTVTPTVSGAQGSGTHGAPPPRPPPPVLPASPTARTAMKRPASHGPHLAAIVESSQSQSQQDLGEHTKEISHSNSRDDEWVMLHPQISIESAESNKSKKSNTTNSQSSIDECTEVTEDLMDSAEVDGTTKEEVAGTREVDLEDIDAIVAEFEQLRRQAEAHDAEIEAQYTTQHSQLSDSTDVSESEVVLNNSTDGTVAFKPKKPLGYSKSLPVETNTNANDHPNDTLEADAGVSAGSQDTLLAADQVENINYCEWDKEKKEQAKKKRGGSFFNKWRNKDKVPSDSDSKSPLQNEQNLASNRKNSHSENDLFLSANNGRTPEKVDNLDGSGKKESQGGIMRRLSKMVKNQAEDSDDGVGSSSGTPKKRKSRLDQKISFIDLSMEDVPKHPPNKKMTYGDHVHVGMCLNNLYVQHHFSPFTLDVLTPLAMISLTLQVDSLLTH